MQLQERINSRIFINSMRYSIYRGAEHDLYLTLPDFSKLQRCFQIIFDKEGLEPPVITIHSNKYYLTADSPLLTHENGYYAIHGKYKGTKGLHNIVLHRLAYQAFYQPTLVLTHNVHIHHIDRNKHNNAASNLVAVTEEEHCIIHNRDVAVGRTLLTPAQHQANLFHK